MNQPRRKSTSRQATTFRDLHVRKERRERIAEALEAQRQRRVVRDMAAQVEHFARRK